MLKKLRFKFVCINMLIVTIILGLVFAMVLNFTKRSIELESIRTMQMAGKEHGPRPDVRGNFLTISLDENGEIDEQIGEGYDLTREEIKQIVQIAQDGNKPVGEIKELELRYLRVPDPYRVKIVFTDTSFEKNMMFNLVRDCLVIGGVSLTLFFVISLLLARWAVRPVAEAWNGQKKFVADASHELKTPLTVILTNAELLRSSEYDQSQKESFAQNILTMGNQMKNLVEKLLELAKIDAGVNRGKKKTVDFSALTSETVLPFEASFFEKGLTLQCEIEENLCVFGVKDLLGQLSEILLDNAIKYSHCGTTKVQLRGKGKNAVLTVSNPGDQLSDEQLRNVFKRFYRADQARGRNGSFGLGLAIAWQIVQDHRGKITAESENGMNTFIVSIPLIK